MAKTIAEIKASNVLTAYEVFRLWQDSVASIDADRAATLKPQFVYNYSRNGLIVKGRKNGPAEKGTEMFHRYTPAEASEWIAKWIKKNLNVETVAETSETESTEVEGQMELLEI